LLARFDDFIVDLLRGNKRLSIYEVEKLKGILGAFEQGSVDQQVIFLGRINYL
jgi:hypothetical protein